MANVTLGGNPIPEINQEPNYDSALRTLGS